jgi:prolipoprotein diacylglyceryltransferase
MLDSMALGGGVGIALGRLCSLFNTSDRGMILPENIGFPYAYATTNAVSGAVENRLATFMIQSFLTGGIVVLLMVYLLISAIRRKRVKDGDIFLLFCMLYGSCQIVCDSTRVDQLFFRSNGFVSVVQILSLVIFVIPLLIFSIRMVQRNHFRVWYLGIWIPMLAMMGVAGYMEYYVQRHGTEAAFAYTVMSGCLIGVNLLGMLTYSLKLMKAET